VDNFKGIIGIDIYNISEIKKIINYKKKNINKIKIIKISKKFFIKKFYKFVKIEMM
jgi:hypothetical protein